MSSSLTWCAVGSLQSEDAGCRYHHRLTAPHADAVCNACVPVGVLCSHITTLQALPLTSADRFDARPPWMVGTPQLLTPDDTSPFYELAPIPPGEMQYAVDTPCFRWALHQ